MMREGGFTLLEIAVATAIIALTAGGAALTTQQVMQGAQRTSDQSTAIRYAQNAGYWISNDGSMSDNISIGDDLGTTGQTEFAVMHWKEFQSGDIFESRYVWSDSAGGLKKLHRNLTAKNKDGVIKSVSSTLVADNIYSASLSQLVNAWKLTVETRSGTRSASREYEISRRISS